MEKEEEKTEQAELDSYMDVENAGVEAPSAEDRVRFLKERLAQIKHDYKVLQLQQDEIKLSKRTDLEGNLGKAFADNYKARKYAVRELRKCGEKVEDKFVP